MTKCVRVRHGGAEVTKGGKWSGRMGWPCGQPDRAIGFTKEAHLCGASNGPLYIAAGESRRPGRGEKKGIPRRSSKSCRTDGLVYDRLLIDSALQYDQARGRRR